MQYAARKGAGHGGGTERGTEKDAEGVRVDKQVHIEDMSSGQAESSPYSLSVFYGSQTGTAKVRHITEN